MATTLGHLMRLARAGIVLARHGAALVPKGLPVPLPVRLARVAVWPLTVLTWPLRLGQPRDQRLSRAFASLGPSYIKLGQFLATRGDLIDPALQRDLAHLQDRLPPFSDREARAAVEEALGGRISDHFAAFGPAIAAASIAQVHKAVTSGRDGPQRTVAVKILRPGVEARFARDLGAWRWAAGVAERVHAPVRRLKPRAVVDNLAQTTALEMDLRLEAAAMSELAENAAGDAGFRVPAVDWRRTARRVLTTEWIDGVPIGQRDRLAAAGHDLSALGLTVIRTFLRHAMRDGFFHGDMHQGNLFVDAQGTVVAVDFGITGRLGMKERRFLAEILHGLITRNYRRAAEVHFEAGYVPPHQSVDVFAQAMRAIGEPIHGRRADEISMADLLGQLFAYTDVFDMQTRPELILLQKSMVIVEGVARGLDPRLDMWTAAEPVAREWLERNLGLAGRLREAGEGAELMGRLMAEVPRLLTQAERAATSLAETARDASEQAVTRRLAAPEEARSGWRTAALWLGASALVAVAAALWLPLL